MQGSLTKRTKLAKLQKLNGYVLQKISSDYKWETFLSISPITVLGLCELRELCERLILSLVWAVLLHKAGGVFTPRPCAFAGKQQVVLDFF